MANVSVTKRLKEVITTLQKNAECPICLETVKIPFKLCEKGHAVCLDCMNKLEKCPLCQKAFSIENAIWVRNMLEALPRLCRNTDVGCEEVVEPGNDHETFCGFRPIVCREYGCSVKVPITQLMDHYKNCHSATHIFTNTKEKIIFNNNPNWDKFTYVPIFLFGNFFWIVEVRDLKDKLLKTYFQSTPREKLDQDYYVCIKYHRGDFNYSYVLKASVLSSCESKLVENDDMQLLDGQDFMKIPLSALSRFTNEKGKVSYEYHFFKE